MDVASHEGPKITGLPPAVAAAATRDAPAQAPTEPINARTPALILLALAGTLAAIALVWTLALNRIDADRAATLDGARRDLRQTAQLVSRQTEITIKRAADAIAIFGHSFLNSPGDFPLNTMIAATGIFPGLVQNVVITDELGQVRASVVPAAPGTSLADLEHFQALRHATPQTIHVSRSFPGRITGKPAIRVSRPLHDDAGFRGIIIAAFNPETFIQGFEHHGSSSRDVVAVFGRDGFIRTRKPYSPACETIDFSESPQFKAMLAGDETMLTEGPCPIDGVNRLWHGVAVRHFPLLVAVARDKEAVLVSHHRYRNTVLLASVGATIGILGFVGALLQHMINQEREAAALAAARRQADAKSQEKSRFLAEMSHELRTPLNAVIGFSDMIAGQYLGPIGNPRYREYAADIAGAARHLHELLSSVLDQSKIEAGRFEIKLQTLDVAVAVGAAIRMASGLHPRAHVLLQDHTQSSGLKVRADARALHQVLLNLLSNAVKYTPDEGEIRVEVAARNAGTVEIRVVDTGFGIPSHQLARIMEPYAQADTVAPHGTRSTGLGLAISRQLLELMGGSLAISSQEGAGTTVSCMLPAA